MAEGQDAFDYTAANLNEITGCLSSDRMSKYMVAANHDPERALQYYLWNARLSKALRFPLEIAEVTVRNRISGGLRDRWSAKWFTHHQFLSIAADKTSARLAEAIRKVGESPPRVIAELSFGFWTALLQTRFHESLWRGRLLTFFPNLPTDATMEDQVGKLLGLLEAAIELRNRIAHLEPIFRSDLSVQHSNLQSLIGLASKETSRWVGHHSTLQRVIRDGPEATVRAGPVTARMKRMPPTMPSETSVSDALAHLATHPFCLVQLEDGLRFVTHAAIGAWLASHVDVGLADLNGSPIGEIAILVSAPPRAGRKAAIREAVHALDMTSERPSRYLIVCETGRQQEAPLGYLSVIDCVS